MSIQSINSMYWNNNYSNYNQNYGYNFSSMSFSQQPSIFANHGYQQKPIHHHEHEIKPPKPQEMTAQRAAQTINDNFKLFDTAARGSHRDGIIGKGALKAMLKTSASDLEEQRQAAKYLLDNRAVLRNIDTAGWGNNVPNGIFGRKALNAFLARFQKNDSPEKTTTTEETTIIR